LSSSPFILTHPTHCCLPTTPLLSLLPPSLAPSGAQASPAPSAGDGHLPEAGGGATRSGGGADGPRWPEAARPSPLLPLRWRRRGVNAGSGRAVELAGSGRAVELAGPAPSAPPLLAAQWRTTSCGAQPPNRAPWRGGGRHRGAPLPQRCRRGAEADCGGGRAPLLSCTSGGGLVLPCSCGCVGGARSPLLPPRPEAGLDRGCALLQRW
jgi:hypothetical protein